jgi:hypothetical protein
MPHPWRGSQGPGAARGRHGQSPMPWLGIKHRQDEEERHKGQVVQGQVMAASQREFDSSEAPNAGQQRRQRVFTCKDIDVQVQRV